MAPFRTRYRRRRRTRAAAWRLRQFRSRRLVGGRLVQQQEAVAGRAQGAVPGRRAGRVARRPARPRQGQPGRRACRTSRRQSPGDRGPRSRRPSRSPRPNRSPSRRWSQETSEPERRPTAVTVRPQAQPQPQPQRSQQTQWPDPPGAASAAAARPDPAGRARRAARGGVRGVLPAPRWLRLRLGRGIERAPPNAPVQTHDLLGRHRRTAERRQIHAVQPAGRQAPGAGRRPARRHPRPPRGLRAARRSRLHGDRHRGPRGVRAGEPDRPHAGANRGRDRRGRRGPVPDRCAQPARCRSTAPLPTSCAAPASRRSWWRTRCEGRAGAGRHRRGLCARARRSGARSPPSTARGFPISTMRCARRCRRRPQHPAERRGRRKKGRRAEPDPSCRRTSASPLIGRPNTGKSTLVNRLLGEERLLTGPEAGITRDSIAVDVDVARPHIPHPRHRRPAAALAHRGEAREALGRRRDQRDALRRGGDRADGFAGAVRGAGPAHRRSGRARRPRGRDRHEQMGPGREPRRRDEEAARGNRSLAAAAQGRAGGRGVGDDRRRASTG